MENANVLLLEDAKNHVEAITRALEREGHVVVGTPDNKPDLVMWLLEHGSGDHPDPDVIMVDGTLYMCEGEDLIPNLRESFPEVPILGIAGVRDVDGVDENIQKGLMPNVESLQHIVDFVNAA